MSKEQWIDKLKNRLDEHAEPLPPLGWERLEEALGVAASSAVTTTPVAPRVSLYRRWTVAAAAAAVLVAVSFVGWWLLNSPMAGEVIQQAQLPAVAEVTERVPDALPEELQPARAMDKVRPALVAQARVEEEVPIAAKEPLVGTTIIEEPAPRHATTTQRDDLYVATERPASRKTSRGWSVALVVNPAGAMPASGNEDRDIMMDAPMNSPYNPGRKDSATVVQSRTVKPVPKREIREARHKQPVSFGLTIRKELGRGFSLESGVMYTYLASEIEFKGDSKVYDQRLHYIGIPLRANWNFLDNHRFTMYLSAGGAVEKCIYGTLGDERQTVKPLQLSLMSALGAQYNLSRRVGIYLEPGLSYYFDDGSSVESIRKERPLTFTLQGGIRLTY